MALSPGIPTSFVPKQPLQPKTARAMASGNNLFLMVAFAIAGIAIVVAIGTFAYDRYLQHQLASKQAQLATAQSKVDENTVQEFVRLRSRLTSGSELLANHLVLSHFFDALESLTLQNVRFNTMKLVVAGDHTAKLEMGGSAKNFNALAAQSNAIASEKRIKRAIFSGISLSQDKLVSFTMTADIDSKLVVEGPAVTTTSAPKPVAATTTPAVSTTTPGLPATTKPATTTPSKPVVKTVAPVASTTPPTQ